MYTALQMLTTFNSQIYINYQNYALSHLQIRSSAIAEVWRNVLYQLKSCQLLQKCAKNHISKGLQ